jgi:SAM-dependent methyltransferase
MRPMPDMIHHDRILHSAHVDVVHDLDVLPWPWSDGEFDHVMALDVMEHLRVDVQVWLDESWRILKLGGELHLRLPAWDNPVSWRDPTHRRVFHPETFDYWDPSKPLHSYGAMYFAESGRWWSVLQVEHVNGGDLGFILRKEC